MCKVGNKRNKEKCKQYKIENRRAVNKQRKANKLKKHLAKCAEKYGFARAEKELVRKAALLEKKTTKSEQV